MSGDGNTKHKLKFIETNSHDPEFLLFKLHRDVPEFKNYFDEFGKSTGNGYDWRDIDADMRPFTKANPGVLIQINETGTYGGEEFEYRYYFRDGKSCTIEPVIIKKWPDFKPEMLK